MAGDFCGLRERHWPFALSEGFDDREPFLETHHVFLLFDFHRDPSISGIGEDKHKVRYPHFIREIVGPMQGSS